LALVLQDEGEIDAAIQALLKARDHGKKYALILLGNLYLNSTEGNEAKAKEAFETAVQEKVADAYYSLGRFLLRREKNTAAAVKVLNEGVKSGDAEATHLLAHLYQESGKWSKAEDLYIQSYHMGKDDSLICLADGAFYDGKEERKAFILELFKEDENSVNDLIHAVVYCKLLVWNDKVQESISQIQKIEPSMLIALEKGTERYKDELLAVLTDFFIRLIAKRQYKILKILFDSKTINYKQILKPVYYAFMTYLKDEFPNEYLKAGSELNETINEIINEIENVKKINQQKLQE